MLTGDRNQIKSKILCRLVQDEEPNQKQGWEWNLSRTRNQIKISCRLERNACMLTRELIQYKEQVEEPQLEPANTHKSRL
jgi:hypothetical protein